MNEARFDITVIIATRNRSASLRATLDSLSAANRDGLAVQVVVVDNGSDDDTRAVIQKSSGGLPIRHLFEPAHGVYGKSHALNCALNSPPLGRLAVVLDDDMSVATNWWRGVRAISERHPEADLFTGCSPIIWPTAAVPEWAKNPSLHGWMFSVRDGGPKDRPLSAGQWFSGNFFWFRSRVLADGRRFPDTWLTEPQFMLRLIEDGYRAAQGPDAQVGHRIQPELLRPEIALKRAAHSGKMFAQSRLVPFRRSAPIRQAR